MQFKDVCGQRELKQHLIDEVNADKISHAQLFLGKMGYGGLPLAIAFIQYLFCNNKSANDSCGECPACHKVMKLQHPDLHFSFPTVQTISKTSTPLLEEWRDQLKDEVIFNLDTWVKRIDPKERKPIISVHESQEIIKKLTLKSFEGGYKVMLIWMPEEMKVECANKLLKILEEPPKDTLFLLVSESSEKMLQTILSRTQIVTVPRLDIDDLTTFLKTKHRLNSDNALSLASRSDGDIIEMNELMEEHDESDVLYKLFIQLMRVCYKKDVIPMMDWADAISLTTKGTQKQFLKYALHMFRQSILKNYTDDQLTRLSEEEDKFLKNFARFITGNNLASFMKTFDDAYYELERNANPKIMFTNLCFQVMRYIHKA